MLRGLTRLPRTVWLLSLVSLFNDSASELIYPLVPLYLDAVLRAGPGKLGLIEGIAEATGSVLKLFTGVLADRTRTMKPWVVGGYTLSGLSRPLFAFAASWPVVLALRFSDRAGKALRASPRDALLAHAIRPTERGLAFGLHRAMDNLGAVIGPLLAAGLLAADVPLKQVFLWASLGGVAAVAGTLLVQEPALQPKTTRESFDWSFARLPVVFKRYLVVLGLFTLGNASSMFALLRARELGLSEAQVPLLWALVSLVASIFSTPLSALSDRFGRKPLIVTGWAVYAVFYLLFAGMNASLSMLIWPLFAVYGLFMALTAGAEKAFVADIAPTAAMGTAFGWFNLVSGLLLLPASLVAGLLWDQHGAQTAFLFSAACACAAAFLMVYWVKAEKS